MMHLPLYSVTADGVTPLSFLTHLLPLPLPCLLSSPSSLPSYSGLSPPCAVPTPASLFPSSYSATTCPLLCSSSSCLGESHMTLFEDGCTSLLPCGSGGPRSVLPSPSPALALPCLALLAPSPSLFPMPHLMYPSLPLSSRPTSIAALIPLPSCCCHCSQQHAALNCTVCRSSTAAGVTSCNSAVLSDGCQTLPHMSVLPSPVFPPLLTAPCFSPFPSASAAAGTHALAPAFSSLSSISAAASTPNPAPSCSSFSSASTAASTHAQVPSFSSFSSPSATAHALTFSFFSSPSSPAHALTFVARSLPPSLPPLRSPMASLLRSTA
ncbi:unnamed protein product [Closterium sp. NIES-54]